ncbi:hypothetical protein JOM56_012907 [Amanita muscaria]
MLPGNSWYSVCEKRLGPGIGVILTDCGIENSFRVGACAAKEMQEVTKSLDSSHCRENTGIWICENLGSGIESRELVLPRQCCYWTCKKLGSVWMTCTAEKSPVVLDFKFMARTKHSALEPETKSSRSRPKERKTRTKGPVPGSEAVGHSVESLPDDESANCQTSNAQNHTRSLRPRVVFERGNPGIIYPSNPPQGWGFEEGPTTVLEATTKATVPRITPQAREVIASTVSKKRPPPSPKVSEKVKAARVSSNKAGKRLATGDSTNTAVVNPATNVNPGKAKRSQKGQVFHLAPSMDIDSDASAESVPESEEESSNHSPDEADNSDASTASRSESNDNGEDSDDVEGPVDVQMISRALNESEAKQHATFGGDSDADSENQDLNGGADNHDIDPDVTIRAINPHQLSMIDSEPENDTDNEVAPTTLKGPVRNCIRRTYAVQDLRSLHSQALSSRATSEPSSGSSGDLNEEVRPSQPQTKKAARLAKQRQNEVASWDASNGTQNSNSTDAVKKDEARDEPTNAGEWGWPKWTDLNHQGLVANLTSQSAEVQEVARAMIGATAEHIIFDEAYPNEDERIRNLRKMMKDIAISFGYHTIAKRVEREKNYFAILSSIPSRRVNNLNSNMRASANNAASLYDIPFYKAKGLDELDVSKIYIFPLKT